MSSIHYRKYFADRLTEEVKKAHGDGNSHDDNIQPLDWAKDHKQYVSQTGQKIAVEAVNNVSFCLEKVAKHNNSVHPVSDELKRSIMSFVDINSELSVHVAAPPGVLQLMQKQREAKQRHDRLKEFEAAEQERLKARDTEVQNLNRKCQEYQENTKSNEAFLAKCIDVLVSQAVQLAQNPVVHTDVALRYHSHHDGRTIALSTQELYEDFPYWNHSFQSNNVALLCIDSVEEQRNQKRINLKTSQEQVIRPLSDSFWKDTRYIWAALLPRFLSALHAAGYKAFHEEDENSTVEDPKGKITIVL